MTSWRQFQANRLNALKSTGPRTEEGKRISRRNALRQGLTAEPVIDGLEDIEDYRGFEAAIISDYDAETSVERELVLRQSWAGSVRFQQVVGFWDTRSGSKRVL